MKNKFWLSKKNDVLYYKQMIMVAGFTIKPKNSEQYSSLVVSNLHIYNPDFIQKIIKKKLKKRLDLYTKIIINSVDEDDEDGVRQALDDLERLKGIVENRYQVFLKRNYYELLLKKLNNFYRKLKEKEALYLSREIKEEKNRAR